VVLAIKGEERYDAGQFFEGEMLKPLVAARPSSVREYLFPAAATKDCGITWMTNHSSP